MTHQERGRTRGSGQVYKRREQTALWHGPHFLKSGHRTLQKSYLGKERTTPALSFPAACLGSTSAYVLPDMLPSPRTECKLHWLPQLPSRALYVHQGLQVGPSAAPTPGGLQVCVLRDYWPGGVAYRAADQ